MSGSMEQLYQQRLRRYLTAMRNEKPDRVPVRPFAAEMTATHCGFTCQQVTHDYRIAFEAVCRCCKDYDWDAAVANMVYVWTGLSQSLGLKYYGIPGLDVPPDTGFQYREPGEDDAFMKADEYDALIADPTGFLYETWLPRISTEIAAPGAPNSTRSTLALVKGSMAMLAYFMDFGPQVQRMRQECGTVSAIAGILKAPMDILADKLRGYLGLATDLIERPEKVKAACEALLPHLFHVANTTADPLKQVPVGYWMHRGCIPFVSRENFEEIYWPTIKPIITELWRNGHQTLFYAEGNWDHHLDRFAELPERSIVYHVDRGDIFLAHKKLHHRFCLSGGLPNFLLAFRGPAEVRDMVRKIIEGVAGNGGYIVDASAIMQNEIRPENVKAMTDAAREFGTYSGAPTGGDILAPADGAAQPPHDPAIDHPTRVPPGIVRSWDDQAPFSPPISGDPEIVRRIWNNCEGLGNMFIWQVLLSF